MASPLYRARSPAAAPMPMLEGAISADVAIIGGGITGLSAALHLAESGARVALLEAHEAGWGASGRNGGQVNPGLKHDPDVVERDFGAELGARMNRFAGEAPARVFALVRRYGIECDARQGGTLRAALDDAGRVQLERTMAQLRARGIPAELLDRTAVAAVTGTDRYAAALLDHRGGDLNPLAYCRGLARAALARGARLHGATRALALERGGAAGAPWRVRCARGTVEAAHIV